MRWHHINILNIICGAFIFASIFFFCTRASFLGWWTTHQLTYFRDMVKNKKASSEKKAQQLFTESCEARLCLTDTGGAQSAVCFSLPVKKGKKGGKKFKRIWPGGAFLHHVFFGSGALVKNTQRRPSPRFGWTVKLILHIIVFCKDDCREVIVCF